MKGFGSITKKLGAGGLSGAGVLAAQPSAHGRAPPAPQHQAPLRHHEYSKGFDDDWELTDFDEGQFLFKPFSPSEVEEAVQQMGTAATRCMPTRACVIEELDGEGVASPPTGTTSEGSHADHVIEDTHVSPQQQQMADLLKITCRLMQRPGLQREVINVMMDDLEVRELMLKQSPDLDQYLAAVGVHAPNLLLPPAARSMGPEIGDGEGPPPVLEAILNAMNACMDGMSWLGGWFRDRFQDLGDILASKMKFKNEQEEEHGEQLGKNGRKQGGGRDAQNVMTIVMVLCLAVMCMLLIKRPIVRAQNKPAF